MKSFKTKKTKSTQIRHIMDLVEALVFDAGANDLETSAVAKIVIRAESVLFTYLRYFGIIRRKEYNSR